MESILVVSASQDKTIKLWRCPKKVCNFENVGNLRSLVEVFKFLSQKEVIGLGRVSKKYYEASFHCELGNRTLKLRKVQSLKGHTGGVVMAVFSKSKKFIVSASEDKTIRIWNLATGLQTHLLEAECKFLCVSISGDDELVVSGDDQGLIRVWSLESQKVISVLEGHTGWVLSVAISSSKEFIVSGSADRTVRVWNLNSGEHIKKLEGHMDYTYCVAISSNDKFIVSGGFDNTVRVWDLSSGEQTKVFYNHSFFVYSVVISSKDDFVVSSSADKTVRILDLSSGQETQVFQGHNGVVLSAALSNDGKYIVSGGDRGDCSIRVWDTQKNQQLQVLQAHTSSVHSIDLIELPLRDLNKAKPKKRPIAQKNAKLTKKPKLSYD